MAKIDVKYILTHDEFKALKALVDGMGNQSRESLVAWHKKEGSELWQRAYEVVCNINHEAQEIRL